MARIHVHTHGKSHSIRPVSKSDTSWLLQIPEQVSSLVVKFAKDGLTSTEIGTKLRDEYGIPLVKNLLGKTITEILKENRIQTNLPEDLEKLVKKAVGLQKHLKTHNSDHRNVRSLELLEAKIHRLSKFYKRTGKLVKNWKYAVVIAQLE